MQPDSEHQLRQLFAETNVDLPGEDFTARVIADALRLRRRERLMWGGAIAAAFVSLWFAFPSLKPALKTAAEFPHTLAHAAGESIPVLSQSPLVYIYGMALGGYLLLRLVHRLQIRIN